MLNAIVNGNKFIEAKIAGGFGVPRLTLRPALPEECEVRQVD